MTKNIDIHKRARRIIFKRQFDKDESLNLPEGHPRVQFLKCFYQYAEEQEMQGSVAECGVFRGNFSYWINLFFNNRTLYLCDTFSGFTKQDVDHESELFYSGVTKDDLVGIYGATATDLVLSVMPNPEMCKFIVGAIPESLNMMENELKFCFVSLDLDLYAPMYGALSYFLPRMVGGGVILVHDYFNPTYPGAKKSICDLEKKCTCTLHKVPISDFCSMAIIK
jgi:hypothetical protein